MSLTTTNKVWSLWITYLIGHRMIFPGFYHLGFRLCKTKTSISVLSGEILSSTWLIRNRVTFSGNYAEIAWESFEYLPNSRRLQPWQFCLVFESFSCNFCVIAFKVNRLLIQILAQFCIEKAFLPHMSSFLILTCPLLSPFSIKKPLLSSFLLHSLPKRPCYPIWVYLW